MAERAKLDDGALRVLQSGVALLVASASPRWEPTLSRAWGPRLHGGERLSLLLPLPSGLRTLTNLSEAPRVAVSFTRPTEYKAFQLKGRCTSTREPEAADWRAAQRHFHEFLAEVARVALDPEAYRAWFPGRGRVIEIELEQQFTQAPGPHAGEAL